MSYSEMINFESLALTCKATCNVALSSVEKLDELLAQIKRISSTLYNEKIREYEKYLISEKNRIIAEVKVITSKATEQAKLGTRKFKLGSKEMEIYNHRNDLIDQARTLESDANNIFTSKVELLKDLINEEILNAGQKADENMRKKALGYISLSKELLDKINNIEDLLLRESTYKEAIKNENEGATFEELLEKGRLALEVKTTDLFAEHRNRIIDGIKKDMEKAKIDTSTINEIVNSQESITDIREKATSEIIGEEVRKESLKVILKAIETRGFIVDRKNSIKINHDKNEVYVVGKKASGQTAEFKIYLDGRFSYKFDGFEGQACQKDIEPFMNDLEEIYGMKITGRVELWKNPDKLSSQKYQTYNINKGKN